MSEPQTSSAFSRRGTWTESTTLETMDYFIALMAKICVSPALLELPRVLAPREIDPTVIDQQTIGGHVYRKWVVNGEGKMSDQVFAEFMKAKDRATEFRETRFKGERGVLAEILLTVSPEMNQVLNNQAGWAAALATYDIYDIWPHLMRAAKPPGASASVRALTTLVTMSQTGELASYPKYALSFARLAAEVKVVFQDNSMVGEGDQAVRTCPLGYVSMDTIASVFFLNGVANGVDRDNFRFLLDQNMQPHDTVHTIPGVQQLITIFQTGYTNAPRVTEPVIGYLAKSSVAPPAALKAKQVHPEVKCNQCGAVFAQKRHFHKCCYQCSQKAIKAKALLASAVVPVPTPAMSQAEFVATLSASAQAQFAALYEPQQNMASVEEWPSANEWEMPPSLDFPVKFMAEVGMGCHIPAPRGRPPHTATNAIRPAVPSAGPRLRSYSRRAAAAAPCPPRRDNWTLDLDEFDDILFDQLTEPPAPGSRSVRAPSSSSLAAPPASDASAFLLAPHAPLSTVDVSAAFIHAPLSLSAAPSGPCSSRSEKSGDGVSDSGDDDACDSSEDDASECCDAYNNPCSVGYRKFLDWAMGCGYGPLDDEIAFEAYCQASGVSKEDFCLIGVTDPPHALLLKRPEVLCEEMCDDLDDDEDCPYLVEDSDSGEDSDSEDDDVPQRVVEPISFDPSTYVYVDPPCPAPLQLHSVSSCPASDDRVHVRHPAPYALTSQRVNDVLQLTSVGAFVSEVSLPRYSDTGATYHCTGDVTRLSYVKPCHVWCGGVGTGVLFTMVGLDMTLPVGMRKCYFAEGISDLLSLGYLSSTGRTAFLQDTDCILHVFVDGHLLFSAPKRINNLYPMSVVRAVNHPSVDASNSMNDNQFSYAPECPPALLTGLPLPKLASLIAHHGASVCSKPNSATISYSKPPLGAPVALAAVSSIFNHEQLKRIELAAQLQRYLHYPATEAIATGVSMGAFASASPLDAKDVRNMEAARGPSSHFLAGYFHQKPMLTSTTAPAATPGHTLSFDVSKLSVKSVNGFTHEIRVVSEYEGYFAVIPSRTGQGKDLFEAMHGYIATTYNAQSHRVVKAHADAESVLKSLTAVFGAVGITLTLSPPGQHAQRVERYTQHMNKCSRATLDALPYVLPANLIMYLHMAVADGMSLVPNTASFPHTPYEKVFNRRRQFHPKHPFLSFGAVCVVSMGLDKRAEKGSKRQHHVQDVSKSEIGVCLGSSPAFPGCFLFYVQNGKIMPRSVIRELFHVIPFGWQRKPSMLSTLEQFPVEHETRHDPNVPVQSPAVEQLDLQSDMYKDAILPPVLVAPVVPLHVPLAFTPQERAPVVTVTSAPPVLASEPLVSIPYSAVPPGFSVPAPVQPVQQVPVQPARVQPVYVQPEPVPVQPVPVPVPVQVPVRPASAAPRAERSKPAPLPEAMLRKSTRSRNAPPIFDPSPQSLLAKATALTLTEAVAINAMRVRECGSTPASAPCALLAAVSDTCSERSTNCYGLDPAVLGTVAFLSEVKPSLIPEQLTMPQREQHEVSYNHAKAHPELFPPAELAASLVKEMLKMTTGMGVLEVVTDPKAQIDKNALFVPSMLLSKQKYKANGDKDVISSRFAMIGSRTDPAMFGDTSAATANEGAMLCAMSAFQADAVQHNYTQDLGYESFDVCGAFLHIDLVSPVMIVTRIPANIDHPLAGRTCIVRKSCYGLRQSNKAFADSFEATILSAGFLSTSHPCIYKKVVKVKNKPSQRCYVSTHVDDGKAMFNHRPLYDHLISVLEKRYGTLKKEPLSGFTGTTFTKHANGAFTRTQDGYILRFLESVGLKGITIAKVPSNMDLLADTSLSPPCDQKLYRTLIGSLIHTLKTRYDIQKEVVHLSSKCSCPTQDDLAKVVLVMRYLSGTPRLGPTYHTTQGPTLVCYVDCSYGVHVDGRSHAGFSLHIGADNSPFLVSSRKQSDCVAVGSMEGEYVALSASARKVIEYRYFLESIDFPQGAPTVIFEDNMSAINLAQAPAITKNSRHIFIRHHYIRDCVANKSIQLKHLATDLMLADFLTKPFGPKKYIAFRGQLFNIQSIPAT